MLNLLFLLFVFILATAIGRKLFHIFKFEFSGICEEFVFSCGIGLGIIAFFILIIGLLKVLYWWVFSLFLLLVILWTIPEIIENMKTIFSGPKKLRYVKGKLNWLLIALLFAAIILTLIGALAPPIGNDELAYHIAYPKIFIENHAIEHIKYTEKSLWPFLLEMLFTGAMLIKGVILAKLMHFLFGMLSLMAVFSFARKYFTLSIALLSAVIFYLTPGIFMQATYAYVDLGLAFYIFMALYAFMKWLECYQYKWISVSGIFCGLAMGIKITAIIAPAMVGIGILFAALNQKRIGSKKAALSLMFLSLFTILVAIIWYVRSYIILGNPVFPFMHNIFGGHGYANTHAKDIGMGSGMLSYMLLPWNLTMFPRAFGGEQIGVLFLILLPGIFLIKKLDTTIKTLIAFSLIFVSFWFFTYQNLRFFFPAILMLSIICAWLYFELLTQNKRFSRVIALIVISVLSFNVLLCGYHNISKLKVVFGYEGRDSYLSKTERSYNIAKFVNSKLPEHTKILILNEPRIYYFNKGLVVCDTKELLLEQYGEDASEESILKGLANQRVTHILIRDADEEKENKIKIDISCCLNKGIIEKIYDGQYVDQEKKKSRYSIYKIII